MPTRSEINRLPLVQPVEPAGDDHDVLLVMVPGMGIGAADFHTQGLIGAVERRHPGIAIATVDPGVDAYLDGSVEVRMMDGIAEARRGGPKRLWLAGISLGCQAILRCVRAQPDLAEGLILLTPYLASTGLIAEISRSGGLREWWAANVPGSEPDRALLNWLATMPLTAMPQMFVGRADSDRFATTATMLAKLLPADHVTSVAGEHDWLSWRTLWGMILEQDPFKRRASVVVSGGAA
jgi:pimeloyl-ACP methyl ester carboxylesterase